MGLPTTPSESGCARVANLVVRTLGCAGSWIVLATEDGLCVLGGTRAEPWLPPDPGLLAALEKHSLTPDQGSGLVQWIELIPQVGDIRWFAAPLVGADGSYLGWLCCAARDAAPWTADRLACLQDFAALAAPEMGWAASGSESWSDRRTLGYALTHAHCILWQAHVFRHPSAPGGYAWTFPAFDEAAAQRFLPLDVSAADSYTEAWWLSRLPEDRARSERNARAALLHGHDGYSQEFRCARRDGDVRWLREDVRIERLGEERWWLVGLCTDITELKRSEAREMALSAGLRSVLEIADELMVCPDTDTVYRRAVELARERLGLERCSIFLDEHDEFRGTYGTSLARATTDEHNCRLEKPESWISRLQAGDFGGHRWLAHQATYGEADGDQYRASGRGWVVITPLRTENGTLGVFCNDTAITGAPLDEIQQEVTALFCSLLAGIVERKRAEEALASSETHFRLLIENASDITTIIDANGIIRYESPSLRRILGYAPEELEGRSALEIIHPDDVDTVEQALRHRLQQTGAGGPVEFRVRHKNGAWRTLEGMGNNLVGHPGMSGLVVNSRDITERKLLEEKLLQSQKLEAIGRLAGGVAHDFNNMLGVINGHTELLMAALTTDDERRRGLEAIGKAGDRAAKLTQQLLAFGRRQMLAPSRLDLNEVVANVESLLWRVIGEDIEMVTRAGAGPLLVVADPSQVEQVVFNLAMNARDAMPQGGQLVIETDALTVREGEDGRGLSLSPGSYAVLSVTDTGQGMDAETLEHVFEPFFTTKEVGRGTGLGLATVYGVVQQSGGQILVSSTIGVGTSFRIYLPRCDGPTPAPETNTESPRVEDGCETILLVEDEPMLRSLIAEILRGLGYRILEAEDGKHALQLADTAGIRIDLLLTDVVMPGMGGWEVAGELGKRIPGLRTLFMSGYTQDVVLRHGVLTDGVSFVEKPFTPAGLAQKIREVLS